jgi:hypothetical protein
MTEEGHDEKRQDSSGACHTGVRSTVNPGCPRGTSVRAASRAQAVLTTIRPVVIEWFAIIHPRVGQRETVYAQLLNVKTPVQGAQLSARVLLGKKLLAWKTGTVTNAHGKASAKFRVPKSWRGKKLLVPVGLKYKGKVYVGQHALLVKS